MIWDRSQELQIKVVGAAGAMAKQEFSKEQCGHLRTSLCPGQTAHPSASLCIKRSLSRQRLWAQSEVNQTLGL